MRIGFSPFLTRSQSISNALRLSSARIILCSSGSFGKGAHRFRTPSSSAFVSFCCWDFTKLCFGTLLVRPHNILSEQGDGL